MENEDGEIGKLSASINPLLSSFFRASGVIVGFPPILQRKIGAKKFVDPASVFIVNEREMRT